MQVSNTEKAVCFPGPCMTCGERGRPDGMRTPPFPLPFPCQFGWGGERVFWVNAALNRLMQ